MSHTSRPFVDHSQIASATGTTTTTSGTYVLVNSMTLTPDAGTYIVAFSSSYEVDSGNETVRAAIFAGGSIDADSEAIHDVAQADVSVPFSCHGKVTVNGSQAIEGRWQVTNGQTATMNDRNLIIKRVI